MIPPKTDKKWEQLVSGRINKTFKSFPLSMMLSRHKREIMKDSSLQNINMHVDEAYEFFIKYERILEEDIIAIFG